ncbi:MAG: tetraacyldisaccharide 4'-kinase [Vicingaceae bacterium]
MPFTLLYSIGVGFRNIAFDLGILKAKNYSFPLISIGNLSVGGTGKTPTIEYIVELLKDDYSLATLSRGYGRKTKGFKLTDSGDNAVTVGDEPFQIFKKYPEIIVAVDGNRKRGISKLRKLPGAPEVILLDDAYQHRYVKPGLNILLTDYSKLYIDDLPLPSGRLRENRSAAKRADIIVVTKSPKVLSPLEIRRITTTLRPTDYQKVFFSYIDYQELLPLNEAAAELASKKINLAKRGVLLVSAIANPRPLKLYLKRYAKEIDTIQFKDHHYFTEKDYKKINKQLETFLSPKKMVVITEKDAVKFDANKFENTPVFCMPIRIEFHQHELENFSLEIKNYVESYKRNEGISNSTN